MSIDQRENEVISWAVAICDNKESAEAARTAGNMPSYYQFNGAAEAARQKLTSLGYGWVATALSADGATSTQARIYVQALRRHLDMYDPGNTPALSLSQALAMQGSTSSTSVSGVIQSLTSGALNLSAGARAEATSWQTVVAGFVKILLPVFLIFGVVRVFRIKAHLGGK